MPRACSCGSDAVVEFDWPGQPAPTATCERCGLSARAVAEALGMRLPMRPILTGQERNGPSRIRLLEID